MAITWRQGAIFAAGLALGAAAGIAALLAMNPSGGREAPPTAAAPAASPAPAAAPAAVPGSSQAAPRAFLPCPAQAAVGASRGRDGQFELMSDLSGNGAADAQAFVLLGKEAAASGRPRDAEVAFLMACRVADRFRGSGSVEAAEARYQLARHYASVALDAAAVPARDRAELLRRAEVLYTESLQGYRAAYGEGAEKTRFASSGLERVRQAAAARPGEATAALAAASRPAAARPSTQ